MRRMIWWLVGGLVGGLLFPGEGSAAPPSPYLSFAVFIGNNRGGPQDRPLQYAESDARRMYRTMLELGGFSRKRSWLVLGQKEEKVRHLLRRTERLIAQEQSRQRQAQILLLIYYSGHADGKNLHLGRSLLSFDYIRSFVRQSKARIRLGIFDTCQSGRLIRKKGRKGAKRVRRSFYVPPVIRNLTAKGEAIITSSGQGEDSHELNQLRGSIFTHYLLSGLRGAADSNGDDRVSLSETYSYAYERTTSHSVFLSAGLQHPSFKNDLSGHGHVFLTYLDRASSRLVFPHNLKGIYYVLNDKKDLLLAEVSKVSGRTEQVGLSPGSYYVIKRGVYRYRIQRLALKASQRHKVRDGEMKELSYFWPKAKGVRWLASPSVLKKIPPPPYQTHLRVALSVAAVSVVAAGVCFGLSFKFSQDWYQYRDKGTAGDPLVLNQLNATSVGFGIGAGGALTLAAGAGVAAVVFHLLNRNWTPTPPPPPQKASSRPTLSPPPRPASQPTLANTPLFLH